ncbi:hypothetical protein [Metabacillus fastidiosus]|uniref:hypothetical protein n=1 Tax=Metabacillus fastidiosus TaxID=1458 RepID=UPI003D2E967B
MHEIENPMILPNGYGIRDPQEKEPKVIGICSGCDEHILKGEPMLDWGSLDLHDNDRCITKYVRGDAFRKIAGE